MRNVDKILIATALLSLQPASHGSTAAERPAASLALTHVTVIDMTGAPAQADMTVIVTGDRITALGPTGKVALPEGAQVLEAKGKYLIPGLWDLHVHFGSNEKFLPFYPARGVTGVVSMADSLATLRTFRQQIAEGQLDGPRILASAGQIVDGPRPVWEGSFVAATEEEGRAAVAKLQEDGSDFVKVYDRLPRAAYFGIVAEARKRGIPVAGHMPMALSAAEIAEAGQKRIEHLFGIPLACSSQEKELRAEVLEALRREDPANAPPADAASKPKPPSTFTVYREAERKAFESYDPAKADALFRSFAKHGTRVVPTLTVVRGSLFSSDPASLEDPRLRYMPAGLVGWWKSLAGKSPLTAEQRADREARFNRHLELVGAMHRAGVEILVGTDTPNPYCFPGFGVHDELAWLVKAGMTPMAALQAATRQAANFLGKLDSFGTVEKGKVADLVLLDANPLDNIQNTQQIAAVVMGGRLLQGKALQEMIEREIK
jgi:imidazolonepropionase-like amidohydrolase